MKNYSNLSPQERLKKICELLVRGVYIHAEEMGQVSPPAFTSSTYPSGDRCKEPLDKKAMKRTELPEDPVHCRGKEYYTLTEAARILGVSKRTLQRRLKAGKVEPIRQGNGYQLIR